MPDAVDSRPFARVLGYAFILAGATVALWLAGIAILPMAQMMVQGPQFEEPPHYITFALSLEELAREAVWPIAVAGLLLIAGALIRRVPPKLAAVSRRALAVLTGLVTLIALYLLCMGGVALKVAVAHQMSEITFYRRTLQQFALLEAAEGRYLKVLASMRAEQRMKLVEVHSVNDFSDDEARERVSDLLITLAKTKDVAVSRRGLATLALFRSRVSGTPVLIRDVPRYAEAAGAPAGQSPQECLEWVAANSNKDGWEPLPLFKLTR
jgi:hypothetical protein